MVEKLGRYELIEELGQGGFAIVHRGHDTVLDRAVALKELRPILLNDAEWVARFHREAKTIARLDHPQIVPIYDVYKIEQRLFIVMRLIDGPSLEDVIHTQKQLSWPDAIEIFTAIAEGLAYAHTQNVLHRDLKPANILIDTEKGAMLSDFGLAKLTSESSMSLSASGSIVGTPHYIAPEIWEGQKSSIQSDIYALGCILYEILTGEKIFKGDTPPAVMMAHFTPLSLPQSWPTDIPTGISEVLSRSLARNPKDRYTQTREMITALTALSTNGTVPASQVASLTSSPKIPTKTAFASEPDDISIETTVIPPLDTPSIESPVVHLSTSETYPASEINLETHTPIESPHSSPALPVQAPPADNIQPESVSSHNRPKRRGCLWIGLGTVAVVIIGLIGLGNFCSILSQLNSSDQPVAEIISLQTEPVSIPFPNEADSADVEIDFGAGQLTINPGAEDALITGMATYNVAQLKPAITTDGGNIVIKPEVALDLTSLPTDETQISWDLSLGNFPMELKVNAGAAKSDLELGGLSLEEVRVAGGATDFTLSFSEPNQVKMQSLRFTGGGSHTKLIGLTNAHTEDILFKGGAGEYLLDFSGEIQENIDVEIDAALGQVTLLIPENIRTSVKVRDIFAKVEPIGAWQQSDEDEHLYILPGDTTSKFEIEIVVRIGAGNLRLETL